MSEILLVNPRRRGAKKRRMSAKQRKYFGKRTKSRRKRATVAAAPRRRRRRARAVVAVRRNPSRRRKLTATFRRRKRHHNPSLRNITSGAIPMLKDGFVGAAGALGLDLMWGYGKSYLPASIAGSPLAQYAVKLAGALAVGMIGNKLLRGKGRAMAVGATTVVLHDALKAQIQSSFPSIQLGEYLTFAPTVGTMRRAGRVLSSGAPQMGEYLSGLQDGTTNTNVQYADDGSGGLFTDDSSNGTFF